MPILQRSLEQSRAGDSIARKLYALLTQGHVELGQSREALAVCRAGKARCPDDAELLFMEGALLRELNEPAGAEACLRRLLEAGPGTYFASRFATYRGSMAGCKPAPPAQGCNDGS